MPEQIKPLWIQRITAGTRELAERMELSEYETALMRDYVLFVAKSNYVEGNSAGIHWARTEKNRPTVE